MAEIKPSLVYRQEVLQNYLGKNALERRDYLNDQKTTFVYALADALHKKGDLLLRFDNREFDQDTRDIYSGVLPNEADLYRVFPLIQGMGGVAVGVGMDTMFDFAANGEFDTVIESDSCEFVTTLSRATMEIGRRFHVLFNRYPTPKEYLDFFKQQNLGLTMEMLESEFNPSERYGLMDTLRYKVNLGTADEPRYSDESYVYEYLLAKSQQPEKGYWISSPEKIAKVLNMYESRKLRIVRVNLASSETAETISKAVGSSLPADLFYSSNVGAYSRFGNSREQLMENFAKLTGLSAIHIETTDAIKEVVGYREPSLTGYPQVDARNLPWTYVINLPQGTIVNRSILNDFQVKFYNS